MERMRISQTLVLAICLLFAPLYTVTASGGTGGITTSGSQTGASPISGESAYGAQVQADVKNVCSNFKRRLWSTFSCTTGFGDDVQGDVRNLTSRMGHALSKILAAPQKDQSKVVSIDLCADQCTITDILEARSDQDPDECRVGVCRPVSNHTHPAVTTTKVIAETLTSPKIRSDECSPTYDCTKTFKMDQTAEMNPLPQGLDYEVIALLQGGPDTLSL